MSTTHHHVSCSVLESPRHVCQYSFVISYCRIITVDRCNQHSKAEQIFTSEKYFGLQFQYLHINSKILNMIIQSML